LLAQKLILATKVVRVYAQGPTKEGENAILMSLGDSSRREKKKGSGKRKEIGSKPFIRRVYKPEKKVTSSLWAHL